MNSMQKSRLSTPRDYLALIVRRKWVISLTLLAFGSFAMLVAEIIPNIYVSESLILFQPGEVSSEFVKEISSRSAEERVTAMQETILSRSNLAGIVSEFESRLDAYTGLSEEKKVERMRNNLEIELMSERAPRNPASPVTHLRIRFRDHSPELARDITARLASLFIAHENRTRTVQVVGTTTFLKNELAKVMQRLHESSEKLKALKQRYGDELPSQLEANLRTLDRLQQQKTANMEALDRETTLRLNLEQQISQTPAEIPFEDSRVTAMRERNPLLDVYLKKSQEYKDLEAKATSRHPDVVRLKAELELLRKTIPPEDLESLYQSERRLARAATVVNPLYQSLVAQLNQVKTEIEIREREKRVIDNEIAAVTRRVQNTPRVEQEIAATERANAELARQAEELRTKLDQAMLAESLESKDQSAKFTIIDPAHLPTDPVAPDRFGVRMAGAGVSLALALLAGVIVDLSKRKIFTSAELERIFSVPVLVEIPRIESEWLSSQVRRARLRYAALVLLGAGAYGWGLYHLYLNQSHLLKVLDPLIRTMQG